MPSLTHVCMWSDKKGWVRITADEAAKLHPGGKVSAHSGLFMCELCGQYVTLTNGTVKKRYFKHSLGEIEKVCPERTFASGNEVPYNYRDHELLPIRITCIKASSFKFEIGFVRAPIQELSKEFQIMIRPKGNKNNTYIYKKERFNCDRITYLSVGNRPYENYVIDIKNDNGRLRSFWPQEIRGINFQGTLFDKETGKMLPPDSDVEIGKEYYLLKKGKMLSSYSKVGVDIHEKAHQNIGHFETWTLYIVSAKKQNEMVARFFLDMHYRLTNNPITIHQVWPLFVKGEYIFMHSQPDIYVLVRGDVTTFKTFPQHLNTIDLTDRATNVQLYELNCSRRQQLISVGRTHELQYSYWWQEELNQVGLQPEISVTDIKGNQLNGGEAYKLPTHKILRIKSEYDGEVIIYNEKYIIDKRKLKADEYCEVCDLKFGFKIQVFVGLDAIWEITYKKKREYGSLRDDKLLQYIFLNENKSQMIPAPHSLRNILVKLKSYPETTKWIRRCIHENRINEQSYRKLQYVYLNFIGNTRKE